MNELKGDISIDINVFTHKVGVYKSEITLYAIEEDIDKGRYYREIYGFCELYERTSLKSVCRAALKRAADWLKESGYAGVVMFTGNAAGDIRSVTSAVGITAYNTGDSELYLSPYKCRRTEQRANMVYQGDELIIEQQG